jgi:nucleoside-diphosphate-sugar epimerase
MRAIVTGGLGFVGRVLAARLAAAGHEAVVFDAVQGDDVCDADALRALMEDGTTVFHLAAIRGGQGEREFDGAWRVNLDGTRAVLEACRRHGGIRLVFASTLAVFGGKRMPDVVDERVRPMPQTTYGATKTAGELLIADYTRKGFVDGRVGRLATVIVNPDAPAHATSAFASAVVSEVLASRDYEAPVALDRRLPVIGVRTAADCLARLAEIPSVALGDDRVVHLPSLAVTAQELTEAAQRAGGRGHVHSRPDPHVEAVVGTWPREASAERALALGLPRDEDVDSIVRAYLEDFGRL